MHRFYCKSPLYISLSLRLPKEICFHIHVLRLKQNDTIQLFNGDGFNYQATIQFIEKNHIIAKINAKNFADNESPLKINLIQCFSTSQKMDFIIQKSVELGINKIYPVMSQRSNAKFSPEKNVRKQQRWQEIIYAACEQSGRSIIPSLYPISSFESAVTNLTTEKRLILHPTSLPTQTSLQLTKNQTITIAIGPEGGFSDEELDLAKKNNFVNYSLGPRILRTETAPIAVLASLQTLYGDLANSTSNDIINN